MKRSTKTRLLLTLAAATLAVAVAGCSSDTSKYSAKDAAQFSGGPMPPEARQKMMDAMAAARNKASGGATNPAQQGAPGGAPR